jgi:site-specific DNA recombinase
VRTDLIDQAVWNEVCKLLADTTRLEREYRQRLLATDPTPELRGLETSQGRLRQGIARLIDSYAEGTIDKTEFDPRITRLRARIAQLEAQMQQIQDQASLERELQVILTRLETFAERVKDGLESADWFTRRDIIRALVKRVEIDQEQVRVIFRVGPQTPANPSDTFGQRSQHCRGSGLPGPCECSLA